MEELCIGKLLALLDRTAVRDAWDVGQFAGKFDEMLASSLFRALFVSFSAVLNHPLTRYDRSRLETRITEKTVVDQLVPMLAGDEKPRAEDLFARSWGVLGKFLNLKTGELEYIEAIQRGELRSELLFPNDPDLAGQIARHPAILWKIKNVRHHLS